MLGQAAEKGKPVMRQLKLISSRDEAGNIRTFVFEADGVEWTAGQHDSFVLPQAGADKADNKRWFTISSAPSEGKVNISTRISNSAFKQALNRLQPGETIDALGIAGKFTWEEESPTPVVLVAGGIGITPFRSILMERHARGKALNATLLYFGRDDNFAFRDELQKLVASHAELKVRYLIGEPITAEKIVELAPLAEKGTVYLSGPEPMVTSVGDVFKERGVALKQDWFPGYNEQNY